MRIQLIDGAPAALHGLSKSEAQLEDKLRAPPERAMRNVVVVASVNELAHIMCTIVGLTHRCTARLGNVSAR